MQQPRHRQSCDAVVGVDTTGAAMQRSSTPSELQCSSHDVAELRCSGRRSRRCRQMLHCSTGSRRRCFIATSSVVALEPLAKLQCTTEVASQLRAAGEHCIAAPGAAGEAPLQHQGCIAALGNADDLCVAALTAASGASLQRRRSSSLQPGGASFAGSQQGCSCKKKRRAL